MFCNIFADPLYQVISRLLIFTFFFSMVLSLPNEIDQQFPFSATSSCVCFQNCAWTRHFNINRRNKQALWSLRHYHTSKCKFQNQIQEANITRIIAIVQNKNIELYTTYPKKYMFWEKEDPENTDEPKSRSHERIDSQGFGKRCKSRYRQERTPRYAEGSKIGAHTGVVVGVELRAGFVRGGDRAGWWGVTRAKVNLVLLLKKY